VVAWGSLDVHLYLAVHACLHTLTLKYECTDDVPFEHALQERMDSKKRV
jgi:hypothetical protein